MQHSTGMEGVTNLHRSGHRGRAKVKETRAGDRTAVLFDGAGCARGVRARRGRRRTPSPHPENLSPRPRLTAQPMRCVWSRAKARAFSHPEAHPKLGAVSGLICWPEWRINPGRGLDQVDRAIGEPVVRTGRVPIEPTERRGMHTGPAPPPHHTGRIRIFRRDATTRSR